MKNNCPRRKRLNKSGRLARAKAWIESYNGKNLVKGYAKWFGVDTLCAIRELKLSGVCFDAETEAKIIKGYHQRCEDKKRAKRARAEKEFVNTDSDSDFYYAYIAGYTENGVPFGITHEQRAALDEIFGTEEYWDVESYSDDQYLDDAYPNAAYPEEERYPDDERYSDEEDYLDEKCHIETHEEFMKKHFGELGARAG